MKVFWKRLVGSTKFWLFVVTVLQVVVYLLVGASKAYIHMDEAYSLALAQYDKIDITENEDFYNTWHTNEYYQDYLAVQEKDLGDWRPVYENQKNDVHPPLYYVLLRGVMELAPGEFSKWPGIMLNIAIMVGCTVLLYAISCKLLTKEKSANWKALAIVALVGLTVAAVSTAVYIRMYALLTLMILLTLWLHMKIREQKEPKAVWYVAIGVTALLGVLTQYYYLFFLLGLVIVTVVRYLRDKRWSELIKYLASLTVAGVLVLAIWPYILQHMFFGYRGQGVLSNLINLSVLFRHLLSYCQIVDYNVFHHLSLVLTAMIIGTVIYRRVKHLQKVVLPKEFWLVFWPTVSYFGLAAIASPFMELRYVMPVCGLIFILVIYVLYEFLKGIIGEKWRNVVVCGMAAVIVAVAPIQIGLGWMRVELLYRDRQAVMTVVTENLETPILYFITTENNRFLDNILPFAEAKESYLALDMLEPTSEEVAEILQAKDLSHGLVVFVSGSQDQKKALEAVVEATGLSQVEWVQGINTCDVYYLR